MLTQPESYCAVPQRKQGHFRKWCGGAAFRFSASHSREKWSKAIRWDVALGFFAAASLSRWFVLLISLPFSLWFEIFGLKQARTHPEKYPWLTQLLARKPAKVAAVAVANKMARIAWAVLTNKESYRAQPITATPASLGG